MRKLFGSREDWVRDWNERTRVEPQFTTRATYNLQDLSSGTTYLKTELKPGVEAGSFQSFKPRSNCTSLVLLKFASFIIIILNIFLLNVFIS